MPKFFYVLEVEAQTLDAARGDAAALVAAIDSGSAVELRAVVDAARVPKVVLAALNSLNPESKAPRSVPVDG